ncbi:LysR family transcriptional regulator [Halomonas sp. PAMB 3264]|uniref:LysR family transcriptional regulator n=1 Tax=Halomonas sp. PAMB 3264 TaxID=3075222 RepID=UPI00289D832B|nr:LysR family transcriptional regulator [Halomonas sp. PAMB 3264]WNL43247.1 LysR family transcriptional regulator [Halomonas sp. PAMB 3264]
MNAQTVKWDDLQIVLAIAQAGSLSGASRQLRISHATVFRRLNALERRLAVTLFERHRQGYTPTPSGEDMAATAERVQREIHGAERRLAGQDIALTGSLRITTTDTLFTGLLSPVLTTFRQRYPAIELEVALSNQRHSLSRREADIALRPTHAPPDTLVGRYLGDIALAVYGLGKHWEDVHRHVTLKTLSNQAWIAPDAHLGDAILEAWMADKGAAYRVDSLLGIQVAIRDGAGIGVLPCYLGESDEALTRLTAPIEALATPLWLLTHPDLRRVARVRAFMDTVSEALRPRLEHACKSAKT